MGSSGAAVNGLTLPARSGTDREPSRESSVSPLDFSRRLSALSCCQMVFPCCPGKVLNQQFARHPRCSVGGLRGRLDLCRQVGTQPIVVMLQILDQALEIAHPRPQPCALQLETIIEIHPLTQ